MKIEMITTPNALQKAAQRLACEPILACDLEADSMHHYREQVCLIQISTPSESLVIDPLACPDLSVLAPIFADPAKLKIFHGADYDVRSLHRDFAITITNLFDTMVASQFLGEPGFGLAAVLKRRFGVELDKKYQQADWTKRPLPDAMIDYAVSDTTLLLELYQQQKAELIAKGRLEWVLEECELLTQVRMTDKGGEPFSLRFKGASRMPTATLAVLEELLQFRDQEAKKRDLPLFKIFGTEPIREAAERKPCCMEELAEINGFSPALVSRYGKGVLVAVERGKLIDVTTLPTFPKTVRVEKSAAHEARLKKLKKWRAAKAVELGIDPGIMANNSLLDLLSEKPLKASEQLADLPGMKRWQLACFAGELLEQLAS